jgi:transcriptional regulator with XRE-family HTH domain
VRHITGRVYHCQVYSIVFEAKDLSAEGVVKEILTEYLKRVMHQKNLKVTDVQESSGLSQGYINELLRGAKTNLTIETIGILAKALEVDGFEVFAAAYGKTPQNMSVDPHLLADTIQKLILNPDLIELVQNTEKLKSGKHKEAVYETARRFNRKAKSSKKRKK